MKRKYEKKNTEYWAARSAASHTQEQHALAQSQSPFPLPPATPFPDIAYGSTVARAGNESGGAGPTSIRDRALTSGYDTGAFQNLRALPIPFAGFTGTRDYTGVSEAVNLCARAWAGVPVVRNAIEACVEFSCQPLYVKCKNETARQFYEQWLNIIQVDRLKEFFFREYYRSGNVFLYRFDGAIGLNYFGAFQKGFGAKENRIPIRYDLLNPANVFVPSGISYPYTYARLLSTWECERLRNPVTEQDKQVYKSLPEEVKTQLKNGTGNTLGVYIPLDGQRLRFSFYKKQSYEPLAIPFAWPVLPAIEWKLMLTKMDMALARTMEQAILLVTTGEAPNQYNGGNGINQNNIARLQALFANHSVGRVLVADYSTKAQWLIPDIKEILGPDKYAVVNEDIKEGLQSILGSGDKDKFANAQIKAQIFIQRLEEGQNRFLNDFLLPEISLIKDQMGFRDMPEIGFQKIQLSDASVMARVYAQLTQLGVLTPQQGVKAIETQVLPDDDEMISGQQVLKKQRDDGLWQPIAPQQQGMDQGGRPAGTSGVKQAGTRTSAPIGNKRATGSDAFSIKMIAECLRESQAVESAVESVLRKQYKVKDEFNEAQKNAVATLTRNIIATTPREKWSKAAASAVKNPPAIPAEIGREIDDICVTYQVPPFEAAIMRHCRVQAPAE